MEGEGLEGQGYEEDNFGPGQVAKGCGERLQGNPASRDHELLLELDGKQRLH